MPTPTAIIRNFCIIAHIDHGKSTLADQFLLKTGTISERDIKAQTLDSMDLERERGITIRMHPVTVYYTLNGTRYELNLIDTPGHVDFNYEVSRSLAACEGAILLVDAFQGVQAQTVANAFLAMDGGLKILPTLNKIDLPHARPDFVIGEMEQALMVNPDDVLRVSGKAGIGIEDMLAAIVERVPPPPGDPTAPVKALIYNSHFDTYKGVVVYIRMIDGIIKPGQRIKLMRTGREYVITEMGQFRPEMQKCDELSAGQVGFFTANIKNIENVNIGDTVTDASNPTAEPLAGYKEPKPMVYSGLFPVNNNEFEDLREALGKLKLNDSSFTFQPEVSDGLGFGFRCGFLGMLHREIIQQRLEQDSNLNLVQTAPNVSFEIKKRDGEVVTVHGPQEVPDAGLIDEFREPIVRISFLIPAGNIGALMGMCTERRGTFVRTEYLSQQRVILVYEMPLAEVIYDLYDKLKSVTHGYGTMDYEILGFKPADLVKMDILVHGQKVDALSVIVHRSSAERRGRLILKKLREEIDRHLFEVALQAAIGARVVARENIAAMRKNVTAKCYGGDITRKRKLWAKQAEGKKRMKQIGQVEVPQEAFLAVLESDE
ncbi:gtp-binding protein : Elongation factor 4 OS=Isosphaera pallida (strain ATCC 43644 / DSM 9630 / IS1B) GN=lepA PE=3 SV=1: GTP_EFTU: GTP_EFTU_D2: EFG_C: LepA_C [Gemmata massiliana]|uniref:Elongation factor 4 n=1 Tax=Gemmata massiliana TaxID=1210884 RepID=A0A6P2D238_9BACT|nr:translation elongation factor 4 [Gemmata massiliana]VTR94465.1 gtp-binding protein : Elongation factor 4 OS=Isosphaera pallida (strain ATCC 43644 / DSM 9630 / IS1B) GN=lepA PE=3 SV=1: GTP_EFTU: GTP_EFTU_D2: EFG_C: LepA_C [Gemmata massiliana]